MMKSLLLYLPECQYKLGTDYTSPFCFHLVANIVGFRLAIRVVFHGLTLLCVFCKEQIHISCSQIGLASKISQFPASFVECFHPTSGVQLFDLWSGMSSNLRRHNYTRKPSSYRRHLGPMPVLFCQFYSTFTALGPASPRFLFLDQRNRVQPILPKTVCDRSLRTS